MKILIRFPGKKKKKKRKFLILHLHSLECGEASHGWLALQLRRGGALARELQHCRLLRARAAALGGLWRTQSFLLFLRLFVDLGVYHQEGGCQKAQEGSHRSHHGNDSDRANHVHHTAEGGGHEDLGDVNLTRQNRTVDAESSLGIPGAVVNVLGRDKKCVRRQSKAGKQTFRWVFSSISQPRGQFYAMSKATNSLSPYQSLLTLPRGRYLPSMTLAPGLGFIKILTRNHWWKLFLWF